jgi:hypothetical protein
MLRVDIGQPAAKSGLFRLYKHAARFPIGFNVAAPSYQSTNALSSGEEVLCVCDTEILMNPCVRLHILTLVPTRGGGGLLLLHASSRPVALKRWPHHPSDNCRKRPRDTRLKRWNCQMETGSRVD